MIHRLYSSLPKFKTLEFHTGFNVLLAEKTPGARKDQTRNAAGKSTTLEIIHYLLGADLEKESIFLNPAISGESFGITFDCAGQKRLPALRPETRQDQRQLHSPAFGQSRRIEH